MIPCSEVCVAGGGLAVWHLGVEDGDAPVLAIHGITSNSRAWLAVSDALGHRASVAAVDLRGRAASNHLPPPFGISSHVRDMIAVLDHLELERSVVVGHSLGAYIAAAMAVAHPDRVRRLVLVDGGLNIPGAGDADPAQFMEAFLGPALARLQMTFTDRQAYRDWWARHPALSGTDVEPRTLAAYADHDLTGEPPEMRSAVNPEAVAVDGRQGLTARSAEELTVPTALLCAPRGLLDDPNPMQPLPMVEAWAGADPEHRVGRQVDDVNHYTIVLGRHGAKAVAAEILEDAPV